MIQNIRHLFLRFTGVCHFNTSVVYRHTPKDNAGIYRRLKVISEDEPDIEKADIDYESIEELEKDFMQAGEMNDEIIREMERISKAHQFKMTERKHFRPPKEPSMLTWSEKEQIRFLHQSDPEKWTPETLAESFPASPVIIKKILKWKWRPTSAERVKAHDRNVSDNWVAFYRGQLDVHDLRLRTHLSKFTDRKDGVRIVSDEDAVKYTEIILPKPKCTEFLSLVTNFQLENNSNSGEIKIKQTEKHSQPVKQIESRNPLTIIDKSQAHYTLEQLCERLENEVDNLSKSPEEIKDMIGRRKTDIKEHEDLSSERYVAPSERFKTDAIVYKKSKKSCLSLLDPEDLPNSIKIPKDKWISGQVYKVGDCFYNDKGHFLYRVPGLES